MNTKILLWLYDKGKRDFSGSRLHQANLSRANLRFACFSRSYLTSANLAHSLLIGADFVYAHLQRAKLTEANCIGANFLAANLQKANLSHASLAGSVFNGANLSYADLSYAALTGAEMRAANLQGVDLSNANLEGANLRAANLYRANLNGASLDGADLSGAIMPDAELEDFAENSFVIEPTKIPEPVSLEQPESPSQDPQAFEAIAIEQDPNSKSAIQKAIESEWGDGSDSAAESNTSEEPSTFERWQLILNDGFGRAFQFQSLDDAQNRLKRSLLLRRGDPQLRTKMLQAYRRCAVSRCTVEDVLEVAYITPFLGDKTNDPKNLLLLRSDLHVLFDNHLLSVDPYSLTVHLAPWVQETHYGMLEGRSLLIPHDPDFHPDVELLSEHWAACAWEHEEAWPETHAF